MRNTASADYWLVEVLRENSDRYEKLPVALSESRFSYINSDICENPADNPAEKVELKRA